MSYIKKVLNNGLRVVLIPLKDTETVTVMVLVETGSEYEDKRENGISHFLEHMCFKGTTNRPTSKIIMHELDSLGASSNAFTSNDHTGYYAKAHFSKTSQILDIVSDMYLNSTFPETEIEKEKGVVIEEITMYEDQPQTKAWHVLNEAMFGDQPAGRTVIGTKETVSAITRNDLIEYRKKHYIPEATTLVISGKIEDTLIQKVETIFGSIPPGNKIQKTKVVEEQSAPLVKVFQKESDQTHIVLAFRTFINKYESDEKVYGAGLLGSILGSGMSSRLFDTIREELGLAYYVGAGHSAELDYGVFTIRMGVSNANVVKALDAVFTELRKIKEEIVPEDEMRRVKDRRKGYMYLGLETSDAWADFYGFQEMYHEEMLTPEELIAKRELISSETVKAIAKEIFTPERLTIAMVGAVKDEKAIYDSIKL